MPTTMLPGVIAGDEVGDMVPPSGRRASRTTADRTEPWGPPTLTGDRAPAGAVTLCHLLWRAVTAPHQSE
ncbi:hypothetical protein GCM10009562_06710 [Nocardioides aquaticus]